jgi:small-conductance mechanosensitive channel
MVVIALLFHALKRYAKKTQQKFGIRKSRYFAIRRMLTIVSFVLSLAMLLLVWDVNLKHVWISLTSVLAVIAVAFFAVWSLVGNILAGFIIYFTSPFKIEDTIVIMPDGIQGTVLAINTFYTVLLDEDKNYINVPNSLFFQKYIQVKRMRGEKIPVPPAADGTVEN